jgi:hypothetical protein
MSHLTIPQVLGYDNVIEYFYLFEMSVSLDLCILGGQVLVVKEGSPVEICRYYQK